MTNSGIRIKHVTSPQNPEFKRWTALLEARGIKKHQQFLFMGRKLVPEALTAHEECFDELLFPEGFPCDQLPPHRINEISLARPLFRSLDIFGTDFPLLVGRLPEVPDADLSMPPSGIEVLCSVGDPANLGAILRSCAAFGVARIVLLEECAHPFHPRALRSASGTTLNLSLFNGPSVQSLRSGVVALDSAGDPLEEFRWPKHVRVVMGEEGQGVPEGSDIRKVGIRMAPGVESLNAAAATAIGLFSYRLQHPLEVEET